MIDKNKNYLNFIAYLQIIGIILVVLGHSFHEFPDGHHGTTMAIYRFFYSFRMPLFLFVSGFLLVFTTEISHSNKTVLSFIKNKIKRLLLPMMVLTAITFTPRSFMSFAADDSINLSTDMLIRSFIDANYMPIPYFWFIHVSFILLCSCFLLINIFRRLGISPLFTISCIFIILLIYSLSSLPATTFFSINQLKRLGFYFALGGIYGLTYRKIDKYVNWSSPLLFGISLVVCLVSFWKFEGSELINLCSFFGIIMCISFAKIIERRNWKFLDHLKGANFIIFLFSWYCNVLTQQVLSYYISLPWWIHTILSLISGIYVPWLGYKYLEKHQDSKWIRFTSMLLGQSFKNKIQIST